MPNYKFLLEYNGKDFSGSQIQNSAQALRTVQGELEKTLERK
jgi:tRNA U38,U39,U40 pseudouridine synthase TruA